MKKLKKLTNEDLKIQYESICNEYIRRFCEKQDIEFDGWVGDEVGGIASFISQYFFNIDDIVFDISTNQPVDLILNWQNDGIDYNMFNDNPEHLNYKSYTMGLRYEHLKKEFQKEYEAYMKRVTDAFVDMQSDKINGTIGHDKDSVFYEVMWEGGLDYKFDLNCSKYIKGVTFEEMKEWNAKVAKRYLVENTLSYDEWSVKYKNS